MFSPPVPSQDDVLTYELLRTPPGAPGPEVIGRATFIAGKSEVDAPENVAVAVHEELRRGFVDRVRPDERPPGYRRSGTAAVDFLVPGMPEHFRARMRGLWLSYPDGSVVTAREAQARLPHIRASTPPAVEAVVTDPSVRQATLVRSEQVLGRPLVKANPPAPGLRPVEGEASPVGRSDCGWVC